MEENFAPLTEAERVFIATIYGEAALSSLAAWLAIASVILNRVGIREWRRLTSPLLVIQKSGFDAYKDTNAPFLRAIRLLETCAPRKSAPRLAKLVDAVLPLYRAGKGTIPNITMYYSPRAQGLLHEAKPAKYRIQPKWDWSKLERVIVLGAEADDFWFYKYADAA